MIHVSQIHKEKTSHKRIYEESPFQNVKLYIAKGNT